MCSDRSCTMSYFFFFEFTKRVEQSSAQSIAHTCTSFTLSYPKTTQFGARKIRRFYYYVFKKRVKKLSFSLQHFFHCAYFLYMALDYSAPQNASARAPCACRRSPWTPNRSHSCLRRPRRRNAPNWVRARRFGDICFSVFHLLLLILFLSRRCFVKHSHTRHTERICLRLLVVDFFETAGLVVVAVTITKQGRIFYTELQYQ